jgi:hypothetical protein
MPQSVYDLKFQIDHVIARQHGGRTQYGNLAIACIYCNLNKGTNLSSSDIKTRVLTLFFNPRHDCWADHFRWRGASMIGLTPIGRATVRLLAMNHPDAIALRRLLINEGSFPSGESPESPD